MPVTSLSAAPLQRERRREARKGWSQAVGRCIGIKMPTEALGAAEEKEKQKQIFERKRHHLSFISSSPAWSIPRRLCTTNLSTWSLSSSQYDPIIRSRLAWDDQEGDGELPEEALDDTARLVSGGRSHWSTDTNWMPTESPRAAEAKEALGEEKQIFERRHLSSISSSVALCCQGTVRQTFSKPRGCSRYLNMVQSFARWMTTMERQSYPKER
ncbi:hypothetical protein C8J56DRAFT_265 [Mycena floridula]|nr:hypothetical protein C8J56DRAFT_265 [Mycena floridula]